MIGLAFQEQDSVVAKCATVALWSAFQKTSVLFGSHAPRPAEITNAATEYFAKSRSIPSRGLSVEQMCQAVGRVGLEQEIFELNDRFPIPFASLLRAYLDFGLPVILCGAIRERNNEFHAITVLAYADSDTPNADSEFLTNQTRVPMSGVTHQPLLRA